MYYVYRELSSDCQQLHTPHFVFVMVILTLTLWKKINLIIKSCKLSFILNKKKINQEKVSLKKKKIDKIFYLT